MVLLVAIVIILAAIVSVATLQLSDEPEQTPDFSVSFESDAIQFSEADTDRYDSGFTDGEEVITLTVSHRAGERVPAGDLRLVVTTGDPSVDDDEFGHPQLVVDGIFEGAFSGGQTREAYLAITNPTGNEDTSFSDETAWSAVDVQLIYEPSNSVVAEERVSLPRLVDGDDAPADGTLTRGAAGTAYDGPPELVFDTD